MEILSFEETKKLLTKYKIPCCKTEIFQVKEEALDFAKKIGFPVVLKIHSKNIFHKSEAKGVKVNIKNEQEFLASWEEIERNMKGREIEGIMVQEMLSGKEIAVGMKRDGQFGPVVMFALGGIFIEVLNDASLRIVPVSRKEALSMIKEIKSYKILEGYRGSGAVDIEKIAEIIVSLSEMSLAEKYIEEIDFNPVIASKNWAKLADFRIIV